MDAGKETDTGTQAGREALRLRYADPACGFEGPWNSVLDTLLRHKSITASRHYGFEKVIHTPEVLDLIRADWQAVRPLVAWVQRATAGVPEDPRAGRR